jgi:hypothetical protein
MRLGAAILVVALGLSACGSSQNKPHLAVSTNGKAVIEDAYSGHLKHAWSCGSLRAALDRIPGDRVGPGVSDVIRPAAAVACDEALGVVHSGDTKSAIVVSLGRPDTAGRCWVFDWPPADAGQPALLRAMHPMQQLSPVDGVRICFDGQKAQAVQTSMHL